MKFKAQDFQGVGLVPWNPNQPGQENMGTTTGIQMNKRRMEALRSCEGPGRRLLQKGDVFWLHRTAAQAYVASGRAKHADAPTSPVGPSETKVVVPVSKETPYKPVSKMGKQDIVDALRAMDIKANMGLSKTALIKLYGAAVS